MSVGASSRISTRPISIKVFRSLGLTGVSFVRLALISRSAQRRRIAVSKSNPPWGACLRCHSLEKPTWVCRQPALRLSLRKRARYNSFRRGFFGSNRVVNRTAALRQHCLTDRGNLEYGLGIGHSKSVLNRTLRRSGSLGAKQWRKVVLNCPLAQLD